jgi:surface protein
MLLENVDVSKLDISNATNIQWFFYKCNLLEKIDVEYWNTSNVTNMECLFDDCLSVKELKVSNWDTSNVINMQAVFSDLVSITTLDVSKWNTSKVTNMSYLFDGFNHGSNIKTIDISNWDVSNVTTMKYMFANLNLEKIKINNLSLNSEVATENMFLNANKLNYIECSNVDTINLFSERLLTKTTDAPGIIKVNGDKTGIDLTVLTAKNWNVI